MLSIVKIFIVLPNEGYKMLQHTYSTEKTNSILEILCGLDQYNFESTVDKM